MSEGWDAGASVYVFKSKKGPVKIGITRNVQSRLASTRYGLTFGPCALAFVKAPPDGVSAHKVEQAAHYILKDHRVRGDNFQTGTEWFNVTVEQAIKAVRAAMRNPAIKPPPVKKRTTTMMMDQDFYEAVQNWRAKRAPRRRGRIPSFSEAIRILVMDSIRRDK
jgi:predicted GIY-YIG superfamily endonuclease